MRLEKIPYMVLVACGKAKHDKLLPARELYKGALTSARMRYAEQSGHPWKIISAKHGLIGPGKLIAPYDMELRSLTRVARHRWGLLVTAALLTIDVRRVEIHAGLDYREALATPLAKNRIEVVELDFQKLRLGIGGQMQFYKHHAEGLGEQGA